MLRFLFTMLGLALKLILILNVHHNVKVRNNKRTWEILTAIGIIMSGIEGFPFNTSNKPVRRLLGDERAEVT